MTKVSEETRRQIVSLVREFVKNDVLPIASQYDNEDTYPHELVPTMRELGLFGITIPEEYGGLGLDHTTMAMIFEELSKGWDERCGNHRDASRHGVDSRRFWHRRAKRNACCPQWRAAISEARLA